MNKITSRFFLYSLFWKQNKHHKHGVLVHTLRVVYYTIKNGDYKMVAAALLHDIGKPFVAYQKPEDVINKEFSFTNHEEISYQIIKNIPFISDYTKKLVRYHFLIRDIKKSKEKNPKRYKVKKRIYDKLDESFKQDLKRFLKYDDLGKGKKNGWKTVRNWS